MAPFPHIPVPVGCFLSFQILRVNRIKNGLDWGDLAIDQGLVVVVRINHRMMTNGLVDLGKEINHETLETFISPVGWVRRSEFRDEI
jgi:hypothetical protein